MKPLPAPHGSSWHPQAFVPGKLAYCCTSCAKESRSWETSWELAVLSGGWGCLFWCLDGGLGWWFDVFFFFFERGGFDSCGVLDVLVSGVEIQMGCWGHFWVKHRFGIQSSNYTERILEETLFSRSVTPSLTPK